MTLFVGDLDTVPAWTVLLAPPDTPEARLRRRRPLDGATRHGLRAGSLQPSSSIVA